jgi:hypothetical protein
VQHRITTGGGKAASCPPISGTKLGLSPERRELENQFLDENVPEIRMGHSVMLAEIMAHQNHEIGALIPAFFIAESPAEWEEPGPAQSQLGSVGGPGCPR